VELSEYVSTQFKELLQTSDADIERLGIC